jgi:hypothetical protein
MGFVPMGKDSFDQAFQALKAAEPTIVTPAGIVNMQQAELQALVTKEKATDGAVPVGEPGKKVSIVGFAGSWQLAPFNDPTWEIWGLNELYLMIPRWTRWFEIHSRKVYEEDKKRTSDHILALRAMTCPVYMHQHYDDIPASVSYPLPVVAEVFANPAGGKPYLTNSISYMIALAILEGFSEISVYGVDMATDSEYSIQRPSCEYFLGFAHGRGCKLTLPPDCELLKTDFLYGYETPEIERWNARMLAREADLNQKLAQIDAQIAQATEARAQYRGALQDAAHIRKNWKGLIEPEGKK